MKKLLVVLMFMILPRFVSGETIPPNTVEMVVDGETYTISLPNTLEDSNALVTKMVEAFAIAANMAIDSSKDKALTLQDILSKTQDVEVAIKPLAEDATQLKESIENLRLNQAKFISVGMFSEFGSGSPTNSHIAFGPLVHFNLFNSALVGLGVGGHFGTLDGIQIVGLIDITFWLF